MSLVILSPPARAERAPRPWTALLKGAAAASRDDWVGAEHHLNAVPEKGRPAEVSAGLALTWLARKRPDLARPLLKQSIVVRPTSAEGHYWSAVEALRSGDAARAAGALDVAVSLAADQPEYRFARGLARAAARDREGAVDDILAAGRLEPNLLVPAYHPDERRGLLRLAEQGLRGYPEQAVLADVMVRLMFDGGFYLEAERRAARRKGRKSSVALEILGRLALRRGEAKQAARLLRQAAAVAPRSAGARFHLARAEYEAGASARAQAALAGAARLDANDPRIQTALGDLYLEQGDLERAELAFGYANAQRRSPRSLVGLGRSLELQGDLEGAGRAYRQALAMAPAAADALERLARLLERADPADRQARALRRRLAAVTDLERDFGTRLAAVKKSARRHADACEQVARGSATAAQAFEGRSNSDRDARAFARAAALARSPGRGDEARQQARSFLGRFRAGRWAKGRRPELALRRKVGAAAVLRVAKREYLSLD